MEYDIDYFLLYRNKRTIIIDKYRSIMCLTQKYLNNLYGKHLGWVIIFGEKSKDNLFFKVNLIWLYAGVAEIR